jgi:sterol desaturase/sphingolipid hydroxylase (fatty acid hydroxylase superfamily)
MVAIFVGVAYIAVFILIAIAELFFFARPAVSSDARLLTNFGLAALNFGLLGMIPVGVVATAAFGEAHQIGLLHRITLPGWAALGATLICRTLIQYGVHRLFHAAPMLWRLHRVHHADRLMDASTALRNHPGEQLVLLALTCPAVLALGLPLWAVVPIELATFSVAVFSHANLRLPLNWSRRLARLIVTPEFHLVHHSAERTEHDSNFGDLVTLWDGVFGSYRNCPPVARLGLGDASDLGADKLIVQLRSPFIAERSPAAAPGSEAD